MQQQHRKGQMKMKIMAPIAKEATKIPKLTAFDVKVSVAVELFPPSKFFIRVLLNGRMSTHRYRVASSNLIIVV
mgnify:CR=1 FL=1